MGVVFLRAGARSKSEVGEDPRVGVLDSVEGLKKERSSCDFLKRSSGNETKVGRAERRVGMGGGSSRREEEVDDVVLTFSLRLARQHGSGDMG